VDDALQEAVGVRVGGARVAEHRVDLDEDLQPDPRERDGLGGVAQREEDVEEEEVEKLEGEEVGSAGVGCGDEAEAEAANEDEEGEDGDVHGHDEEARHALAE